MSCGSVSRVRETLGQCQRMALRLARNHYTVYVYTLSLLYFHINNIIIRPFHIQRSITRSDQSATQRHPITGPSASFDRGASPAAPLPTRRLSTPALLAVLRHPITARTRSAYAAHVLHSVAAGRQTVPPRPPENHTPFPPSTRPFFLKQGAD